MYNFRILLRVEIPMEATVAERGQITLPKAVRDALGLAKGSVLKVELEGGRIVLSKHVDDAISRVRGKFALDAAAGSAGGHDQGELGDGQAIVGDFDDGVDIGLVGR